MQEEALKSLQNLEKILSKMRSVYHSISRSTQKEILLPLQEMDWEEKYIRSEELITILKTSKTEEEILQRCKELDLS